MIAADLKGERVSDVAYRPTDVIVLADDEKHSYIIEAYCLDFYTANPGTDHSFSLAPVNERAREILREGKKASFSVRVIQSALWMDQGVSVRQLKRRCRVSDADIQSAHSLLQQIREEPKQSSEKATEGRVGRGASVLS